MRKTSVLIWFVSALLCPMAPAQTASLDELLAKVAKWDYDQSRETNRAVADMVQKAHGSAAQTRDIEQRFIALLKPRWPHPAVSTKFTRLDYFRRARPSPTHPGRAAMSRFF